MRVQPAFLFDLDGTLVDSVYQHVLAWKEALLPVHREQAPRIGMEIIDAIYKATGFDPGRAPR